VSEERKLILQMVAEGKITPEEADKLLQALDDSERAAHSSAAEQARREEPAPGSEDLSTIINRAVGDSLRALERTLRDLEIDLDRRMNDPARQHLLSRIEEKMRRSAERAVERVREADERARRIADRAQERAREHTRRAEEHARHFEERVRTQADRMGARIFKFGICIDRVPVERTKSFTLPAQPGDRFHLDNRVGDVRVESHEGDQIEVTIKSVIWGETEQDAGARADAFQMELVRRGSDVVMDVLRPTITASGIVNLKESRLDYTVRVPHGTHLDIRCKAGDMWIVGGKTVGVWNLSTKVGDVDVKVHPEAGFTYDLSAHLGNVRVAVAGDQPGETEMTFPKGAYRTGRVGDGAGRVEASVRTGDVRLIN